MKVLKILLLVFAVTLISYLVFYFFINSSGSQISSENFHVLPETLSKEVLDWKQYSSKDHKFSFYYPQEYLVYEETRKFSDINYPFVVITDPKTDLSLIFDFKIEFGITNQGFSVDQYPNLASKPQLIRLLVSDTWIYYQKSQQDSCISPDFGSNVKNGDNNILCYDVDFPFNWFYGIRMPETINQKNSLDVNKALMNFDKLVSTIKN